ncbi:hypothetical protein APHAL10511_001499 [Amanita phalloides]|nr:hypothetical protein APHAL10511_001499 [Amanita phalloides]
MSFLKRLFKSKEEGDYESILSKLANDVHNRQMRLSEIRLRERRSTLLATLYTLAAWGAYISLWYMRLLPHLYGTRRPSEVERIIKAVPVILGPIIILFTRRIVQIWYRRKGDAEEKTLQALMKKQRSVLEDIKKKSNYYSTQELLMKYEAAPINSPPRQRVVSSSATLQLTARPPLQRGQQSTLPTPTSPFTAQKQWYDKLADFVLGDDDANVPMSRYALICEKCRAHNGLVKESLWDDTDYFCRKCNHFNPAPRSKRSSAPSRDTSPQSIRQSSSPEPQRNGRAAQSISASSSRHGGDTSMMEDGP